MFYRGIIRHNRLAINPNRREKMKVTQRLLDGLEKAKNAGFDTITVTKGGNFGNVAFLSEDIERATKLWKVGERRLTGHRGTWASKDWPYNAPGNIPYQRVLRFADFD